MNPTFLPNWTRRGSELPALLEAISPDLARWSPGLIETKGGWIETETDSVLVELYGENTQEQQWVVHCWNQPGILNYIRELVRFIK